MNRQYEYSNAEYLAMVQLYAVAGYNLEEARRLYSQPAHLNSLRLRGIENPQIPTTPTILAATQRLLDHGQFRAPTHAQGRGRLNNSQDIEDDIFNYFELDPRRSTRMAAREFNVSQSFVWKTLNTNGLHPYHFRRAHALYSNDGPPRIALCQWLINNASANILWTDESLFTRVGLYNAHNEHYWALINPHLIREDHHQVRFSVNVWAGIINDHLIGPVFIEGHLTGNSYLHMLRTVISGLLEEVPLAYIRGMYYQHDGCPAHYASAVRVYLNNQFGDRWIGRGGPIAWPARSPDLTPLDFYLWSEIKRLVYTRERESREDLRSAIVDAFDKVKSDRDTLRKLKDNLRKRAQLCIERNGQHFEQLLRYREV